MSESASKLFKSLIRDVIKVFPEYWLQIWVIAIAASILSTILSLRISNVKPPSHFDLKNI